MHCDLVLLPAVSLHLPSPERPRAFRKRATRLEPGGILVLTVRHGPSEPGRAMYPTTLGGIETLARDHGLAVLRVPDAGD